MNVVRLEDGEMNQEAKQVKNAALQYTKNKRMGFVIRTLPKPYFGKMKFISTYDF
jgi:hypothetical protein